MGSSVSSSYVDATGITREVTTERGGTEATPESIPVWFARHNQEVVAALVQWPKAT